MLLVIRAIAGHQGPNKIIAFVADLGGLEASDGIQQAQRLEDIIPGDATDLHVSDSSATS
jgi:hypothetical protein